MKKLIIIDTLNLLFRSYYAMRNLTTSLNQPIGMIFGLMNFLLKIKKEINCDYVIFALDSPGGSFRNELLPEYKANRQEPEQEIKIQIPICIEMIKKAGFLTISKTGYEADDIIASIATYAKNNNIYTSIYSTDKDLYQLIEDGKVELIGKDYEVITSYDCIDKFGVKPSQMVDYLALVGDSTDNFKGVPGIGPVAAKKLLNEFKNIEDIYNNLNMVLNKSSQKKLVTYKNEAFFSIKLAKLVDNLDLGNFLEYASKPEYNFFVNLKNELNNFELYRFLKEITNEEMQSNKTEEESLEFISVLLNDEKAIFQIIDNLTEEIGFDIETTGLEYGSKIVGFSFCQGKTSYYVPILHKNIQNISENIAKTALNKLFQHTIIGHNLKFDFKMLRFNYNLNYPKKYYDSMIAAWLLNPSDKFSLDNLALKYLNYKCVNYDEIVKKDEKFSDIDINIAYKYGAQDAFITKMLFKNIYNKLDENRKNCLRYESEFIKVLVDIESNGIALDNNKLNALKIDLEQILKQLEEKIYLISNEKFNLNSPKQLKEILYNKLSLPDDYKGSTNEIALSKLKHPITELILEYRTANKVLNTYVLPLLGLNKNNENSFIVRSNFIQTGTATGRLSSNNPNLQNIPTKSKFASTLKEAFIAKEGYNFISFDYSQIELRMLAHFSKDPNLLKAFLNDEDIHARTALEIFKEVDKEKRNFAKSINFGLIYGMGARRLSEELNISYSEASEYIKKYFDAFPSIRDYFNKTKKETKDKGYIQTLLGRVRYFKYGNDIKINNANDRECINSILQGSAADLIKLAMIKIYPYLEERAKLILQIHDELIFEVRDDYIEEFAKIVCNIMENAYPLSVRIKTSLNTGKNWADLK